MKYLPCDFCVEVERLKGCGSKLTEQTPDLQQLVLLSTLVQGFACKTHFFLTWRRCCSFSSNLRTKLKLVGFVGSVDSMSLAAPNLLDW